MGHTPPNGQDRWRPAEEVAASGFLHDKCFFLLLTARIPNEAMLWFKDGLATLLTRGITTYVALGTCADAYEASWDRITIYWSSTILENEWSDTPYRTSTSSPAYGFKRHCHATPWASYRS